MFLCKVKKENQMLFELRFSSLSSTASRIIGDFCRTSNSKKESNVNFILIIPNEIYITDIEIYKGVRILSKKLTRKEVTSLILEDKHKCFVCSREINWTTHIKEGPSGPYPYGREPIGDVAAVSSDDNNIIFEITVKCPACQNKNKFSTTLARWF
jgi:hypothetical protein